MRDDMRVANQIQTLHLFRLLLHTVISLRQYHHFLLSYLQGAMQTHRCMSSALLFLSIQRFY